MPITQDQLQQSLAGEYLKASDLSGPTLFVVQDINQIDLKDDNTGVTKKKLCMDLTAPRNGATAKLILNVVNTNAIISQMGNDPNGWIGKPMVLKSEKVQFGSKIVDAVRVDLNPTINPEYAQYTQHTQGGAAAGQAAPAAQATPTPAPAAAQGQLPVQAAPLPQATPNQQQTVAQSAPVQQQQWQPEQADDSEVPY